MKDWLKAPSAMSWAHSGEWLAVEHTERADLAGTPLGHRLDRIVDGHVDMLADELDRDLSAALVGHVGDLGAGRLFESDGDDLIFLLGARAAHLELARGGCLHGGHQLGDRLVG